ncbi:MAG TPA: hypothetical protein ENH12_05480, partial [Proteobacteria bacterium]|nr:hypothetical protein [Pseudomonadota bacterium]
MKRIFKAILLIVIPAAIVSCGSTLPTHYYRINTDPEIKKADKIIPLKVDVNTVRTPDRYRDRIVYRKGEY